MSWTHLLGFREVWGLVIAKFLSDAAWYFYLFWLPKYLYDVRGFDVKQVGAYAWIPYAAAGVGCLAGGWFSSWMLKRGWSVNVSRKVALGASAALMPLIVFVTRAPTSLAIVLFSIAFFGQQSWSTLIMIVPTDLFGRRIVASVAGLVGFGGAMGGVVFNLAVGRILDSGLGYGTVFGIVGTFHVIAFVVILLTIPDIHQLEDARGRMRAPGIASGASSENHRHPHTRRRMAGRHGAAAAALLHANPIDLLQLGATGPADAMATFRFHGWLIVEIFTDAGHVGIGNAALAPRVSKQTIDVYLKPMLIGADPWDVEFLWQHMIADAGVRTERHRDDRHQRGGHRAMGHLGKAAGQPVFRLLGGRTKPRIPVYASRPLQPAPRRARGRNAQSAPSRASRR